MATKYPFDENTRVALLDTEPVDWLAPTEEELDAGLDITCELTAEGLQLGKGNNSISAGGLCSGVDSTVPGRTTFSASLVGFKYRQPDPSLFWDAAGPKGGEAWLYVRYGLPHDQAWTDGDDIEAYHFLWGKRATANSGTDTLATFTVPIHIQEENDALYVGGVS